jgi:hypothetical protein
MLPPLVWRRVFQHDSVGRRPGEPLRLGGRHHNVLDLMPGSCEAEIREEGQTMIGRDEPDAGHGARPPLATRQ